MDLPLPPEVTAGAPGPEIEFCLELGKSLQAYGTPAHRFEETLNRVAATLGLEAQFLALPTGFLAWMRQGAVTHNYFLRSDAGATNLDKLSTLQQITDQVALGQLALREASRRLRAALAAPPIYGPKLTILCSAVSSAAFAMFFGSGVREVLSTLALGGLLGALLVLAAGRPRLERPLPAIGALVVSGLAAALSSFLPGLQVSIVTLAGLILLLPGLSLLTAMNELATGNLVAGTSRLTGAGMIFLQLTFGVVLGQRLGHAAFHPGAVASTGALPAWAQTLALIAVPLCWLVLFQAQAREIPWIAVACWLAFGGARAGTALLGPEFGAGAGAWLLGVYSNLYGRFMRRPAQVALLPGLLVLVPGSVGYRSLTYLAEKETLIGIETGVQMLFVAVSLLVGLLLSRLTVAPRRPL